MLHGIINRMKSWRDFTRGIDLLGQGDFSGASASLDLSITRTGTDYVHPHIVRYQVDMLSGEIEAGLQRRDQIESILASWPSPSLPSANYLRYWMLHNIPDAYLADMTRTGILDPREVGIQKVRLFHRNRFPYFAPRPFVARVLGPT